VLINPLFVLGNNPFEDVKLLFETIGSLFRGQALATPDVTYSNPVESLKRL
jgi:geranylgeranyl reductase